MAETIADDLNEAIKRLTELRSPQTAWRLSGTIRYALCSSAFMSLMVEENASGGTAVPSR
jgi:hypothetical protein